MEFVVYILYSEKFDKTYVGFTSSLIERFKSHNVLATSGYTIKFKPWKVVYLEVYNSKSEAINREKWLKTRTPLAKNDQTLPIPFPNYS